MSELSFDQMLEDAVKTIHNGEVVDGKVISVKEDEIILNIGYKSDGIVTRAEYSNDPDLDLTTVVNVGDELTVKVLKVNDGDGQVLLTYKRLAAEKISQELQDAFENGDILTGKVVQITSGGLNVEAKETRVFIPASLVSDTYVRDLTKFEGEEIEFRIIELNPRKRRIIGDRKNIIVERKAAAKAEALSKIYVGQVIDGTVKNVTDFGAFIDIGGIDGLLHISEMSWGRIGNPKKVFKKDDVVKVYIKEINNDKVALSVKFEDTNPWVESNTKYAVGNIVKGTVARMTDFGAFIELEPGIDALLHVSQIALERIEKPSDVLKSGQEIKAKVVDFNPEDHKISLSIKAILLEDKAEKEAKEREARRKEEEKEYTSSYADKDDSLGGIDVSGIVLEPEAKDEAPATEAAEAEVEVAAEAPAEEAAEVAAEAPAEEAAEVAEEAPAEETAEEAAGEAEETTVEAE